jgi:tRNA-Thr(GGU) m(6)t(6)A37 methyltransferase TsaA
MTQPQPPRPGEVLLGLDPATVDGPTLAFIGRIGSPWAKGNSPKNLREARAAGGRFTVQIDPPYRAGLLGLSAGDAIVLLYWMHATRRDLIVQSPAHCNGPTGTFALRSPARPNPIALAVVRLLAIEAEAGLLVIDAIDAFDGTPVLDIKPWLNSVDVPPGYEP